MEKLAPSLVERAKGFLLASDQDYGTASEVISYLHKKSVETDNLRKWFVKPLQDHISQINTRFKKISLPIDEAISIMKGKMISFRQEQERKRREEEEKAARIRWENEQKLLKAKKPERVKIQEVPQVVTPPPPAAVLGSATRKTWVFTIEDEDKIPRDYLIPDQNAIRAAVRNGIREIPGVRIYEQESIVIR